MKVQSLSFWLVDVFARKPLTGNGLCVFMLDHELPTDLMQSITREMRQFETIFLHQVEDSCNFASRIFTMEEELSFAGHPIIGAAALVHAELFATESVATLVFEAGGREVLVTSHRQGSNYSSEMDQGVVTLSAPVPIIQQNQILRALSLRGSDLAPGLPLQVVSTGLPYLIVPVETHLERAQIVEADFEALLATVGAKFVYVFDVGNREGRTWDNFGRIEDVATGSAAGPAAAYLVAHGLAKIGEEIVLSQGRFVSRPSELYTNVRGGSVLSVSVRGPVCFVGSGKLDLPKQSLH